VTEFCDRLGDLNDAVRASQWLDTVTSEPGRAATVARVRTVEIGHMAEDRASWPDCWDRVRETARELGFDEDLEGGLG
jgi:hypothetical protein